MIHIDRDLIGSMSRKYGETFSVWKSETPTCIKFCVTGDGRREYNFTIQLADLLTSEYDGLEDYAYKRVKFGIEKYFEFNGVEPVEEEPVIETANGNTWECWYCGSQNTEMELKDGLIQKRTHCAHCAGNKMRTTEVYSVGDKAVIGYSYAAPSPVQWAEDLTPILTHRDSGLDALLGEAMEMHGITWDDVWGHEKTVPRVETTVHPRGANATYQTDEFLERVWQATEQAKEKAGRGWLARLLGI